MKTLSDYLMEHGILKNQDAEKMAKEIHEMYGVMVKGTFDSIAVMAEENRLLREKLSAEKDRHDVDGKALIAANKRTAELEAACAEMQKTMGAIMDNERHEQARLIDERDAAKAACAEMREALAMCVNAIIEDDWNKMGKAVRVGEKLLTEATKL